MDKVRAITLKRNAFKKYSIEAGDSVKVSIKIKEGNKERVQIFEGVVLKVQGKDFDPSFTVRKVSDAVAVEKTIPFASPNLEDIQVTSKSKVRRSRLYYLRKLRGRAARLKTIKASKKNKKSSPSPNVVKSAVKTEDSKKEKVQGSVSS